MFFSLLIPVAMDKFHSNYAKAMWLAAEILMRTASLRSIRVKNELRERRVYSPAVPGELQVSHSDQAEAGRRVSDIHPANRHRTVRLLLSRWNVPL